MRKLCPNLEREDALDTVLEVPIPEEMFASAGSSSRSGGSKHLGCTNVKAWMRPHSASASAFASAAASPEPHSTSLASRGELQLMLGVIGAPLIPLPVVQPNHSTPLLITHHFQQDPIESSMAKYIVQQYIAASGGEGALSAVSSMYAMGKVRMTASELNGNDSGVMNGSSGKKGSIINSKGGGRAGEMGGFVLWQKNPDLWCLELVVSGCKISAGSDGRVAWRQTPWHQSHASRGPPRPLRRSLQGLDPMLTANLFSNSSCIGEKAVNGEDCFVLKLDAEAATLRARNSSSVEIIRHSVWGYFSQRTGLLVQLEDSHLLQIKSNHGNVYWETTMESHVEDYRPVDGINIAHAGRSNVSLFRFGDNNDGNTRTRMEETWTIEEVDFNIWGLSIDCFLPPSDLREGGSQESGQSNDVKVKNPGTPLPGRVQTNGRIGPSKVAAIDSDEQDSTSEEEGQS
ncbi:hypothetical protein ACMD2_05986 [Ananas comosus]|uniref:Uncharacterized protein n=1 Tax=Ananas comosus TaxID=4615 RepID=A0A199VTR5_ANACO|nr:hypothetical protein ACMD2_05986 [Ananas comosus]